MKIINECEVDTSSDVMAHVEFVKKNEIGTWKELSGWGWYCRFAGSSTTPPPKENVSTSYSRKAMHTHLGNIGPLGMTRSSRSKAMLVAA